MLHLGMAVTRNVSKGWVVGYLCRCTYRTGSRNINRKSDLDENNSNITASDSDSGVIGDSIPRIEKIQEHLDNLHIGNKSDSLPPEYPSDIDNDFLRENTHRRDQTKWTKRPKIAPEDTTILLFPGQGSQFVGMGKKCLEYPGVEKLYQRASEILGYDLLEICLKGPNKQLSETVYCQPAVVVTNLAAVETLKHTRPWAIENCIAAAGFSVGEISALVFAGSISFDDAIQLVKVRAETMQAASEVVPSGMLSCYLEPGSKIGMACHLAERYCRERLGMEMPVCQVANHLYDACKVVAGNEEALDFIQENGKDFGIRKTKRLPVSGAFHTNLMSSVKPVLQKTLSGMNIQPPIISVQANATGKRYTSPLNITRYLAEQPLKPVMWQQTMHALYQRDKGTDFPDTFETGSGGQLGTLLKAVNMKGFRKYHKIQV